MRLINLLGCRPFAGFAIICVVYLATGTQSNGAVFTQINTGTFVPTSFGVDFNNQPAFYAVSQNDTGATFGFLPNFSTGFDNFSFDTDLTVTDFSWIGGYDVPGALASTFTLNVYNNVNTAPFGDQPGSLYQTFAVGSASQAPLGVPAFDFYSYSAPVTPFSVSANQKYWFSVVADLDFDDNDWGVAFSSIGDDVSFNDFQPAQFASLERFQDAVDYAFSVTAVPEPSTWLLLASVGVVFAYRRKRFAAN